MGIEAGHAIETVQRNIEAAGERLQLCRWEISVLLLYGVELMNDHAAAIPTEPCLTCDE
jgi:hypothetical protein